MSSRPPDCVVDTVILMYFLLAGQEELLAGLLRAPIGVPRVVYDPDEGDVPEPSRCEMSQCLAYHRRVAADMAVDAAARDQAAANVKRLHAIADLYRSDRIAVMDLTEDERVEFASVTSPTACHRYGLLFPLSAGEAACLVMAVARRLTLVTDDTDALRALKRVDPSRPYQRIRKLLIQAANTGLVSTQQANDIYRTMTGLGFWDSTLPFPAGG